MRPDCRWEPGDFGPDPYLLDASAMRSSRSPGGSSRVVWSTRVPRRARGGQLSPSGLRGATRGGNRLPLSRGISQLSTPRKGQLGGGGAPIGLRNVSAPDTMPDVGIEVTIWRGDGRQMTGLRDPSWGTFDAAGDLDSLISSAGWPGLRGMDPFAETTLSGLQAAALIEELDSALANSKPGHARSGLRRLRVMAEMCQADESLTLRALGD